MKEFKEMVKVLTELKNDPYELTRIRLEMACERANNNRIIKTKNVFDFLKDQAKLKRSVVDVDIFDGTSYRLDICGH